MAEAYRLTEERWCWQRLTVNMPDGSVRQMVVSYDAVDARLVEQFVWYARPDHQTFYAATTTQPRDETGWRGYITMHALIMGNQPRRRAQADEAKIRIAHLDGNGLHNRRANLAWMTQDQILAKRRPSGGSSKYKGVCWDREQGKWMAVFRGKKVGRYRDEVEAARAFDTAAREHWGELAYTNFPPEVGGSADVTNDLTDAQGVWDSAVWGDR